MSKLLIIGLDGATWTVLDKLEKQDYLPTLSKLKQNTPFGTLRSTSPALTPAAWSSFHTGQNPGQHGVLDFASANPYTNQIQINDSGQLKNTIWDKLSSKNKKIGLVNVPMTYPAKPISGLVVTGILTPDSDSDWAWPPQLKPKILKQIPDYAPVTLNIPSAKQIIDNKEAFLDQMSAAITQRFQLSKWLISNQDFDVYMVQFQVVDWVQHALWPDIVGGETKTQTYIFENFYKKLDKYVGQLIKIWQSKYKKTNFLLLSDHGFQQHKAQIMLGNVLYQQGMFDKRGGIKTKINQAINPAGLNIRIKNNLHLFGKGSWGRVYTSDNIDQVSEKLAKICEKIVDPKTNKKVIRKVFRTKKLYKTEIKSGLPDIMIEPNNGYSITAAIDKKPNTIRPIKPGQDFHLGTHHQNGIIISNLKASLPKDIVNVRHFIEMPYE